MTYERADAEDRRGGQAEHDRRQQVDDLLVDRQLLLGVDGARMVARPLREEVVLAAGRLEGLDRLQADDRGREQLALLDLQAQRHVGQRTAGAAAGRRC